MPNGVDTCRKFVVPKLQAAGGDNKPHFIAEQRTFTNGRIVVRRCHSGWRKSTDYTAEKVRTLCASPDELRARWADAGQRDDIIQQLAERCIDFPTVAAQAGKPEAAPFDLLCHLAFNALVFTPHQRADRLKQQHAAFLKFFAPEAREILDDLLEKYASDGEQQFTLPDVLKVRPISDHGNVNEIIGKFGVADQLRNAFKQLSSLLYAA
jgi:type I restriction enzyme R subunit